MLEPEIGESRREEYQGQAAETSGEDGANACEEKGVPLLEEKGGTAGVTNGINACGQEAGGGPRSFLEESGARDAAGAAEEPVPGGGGPVDNVQPGKAWSVDGSELLEEESRVTDGGEGAEGEGRQEGVDGVGGVDEAAVPLSKNQQKKLAKQQKYEERKAARKASEKEQRHAETERKRREWREYREKLSEEELQEHHKRRSAQRLEHREEKLGRKQRVQEAMESGQNLVIDLEFAHLMKPDELKSLAQQVMYSYSVNAKTRVPCRLNLTGCQGRMLQQLEKLAGFHNWLAHRLPVSYLDAFAGRKEDLVYLTPDSPHTVQDLHPNKVYIVGGLVDRNRNKNVTLRKATEQGIATARLPIEDHVQLHSSQVLTVNQVMEIMLHYLDKRDWKHALEATIPQRKRVFEGKGGAEDQPAPVRLKVGSQEEPPQGADGPRAISPLQPATRLPPQVEAAL